MEKQREDIIETINKAKEEINKIKENISANKDNMKEIADIRIRLKDIEAALNPKQKFIKESINSLDLILMELSQIKFDIILK